jgi:hypothetical protein
MQLAPGGGASAGRGGLPLGVGTGMPAPPAEASVADIDEGSPVTSGGNASLGSETEEWDSLSRE